MTKIKTVLSIVVLVILSACIFRTKDDSNSKTPSATDSVTADPEITGIVVDTVAGSSRNAPSLDTMAVN